MALYEITINPTKIEKPLSLSVMGEILGLSPTTVKKAIRKADIPLIEAPSSHINIPAALTIKEQQIPALIRHFQHQERRPNGESFNPWAEGIDTGKNPLEFTAKNGRRFRLEY